MKPNIPLIITCLIVFGFSAYAFSFANEFAPMRTVPEKYGYGVGWIMLTLLSSVAILSYIAGRMDSDDR